MKVIVKFKHLNPQAVASRSQRTSTPFRALSLAEPEPLSPIDFYLKCEPESLKALAAVKSRAALDCDFLDSSSLRCKATSKARPRP